MAGPTAVGRRDEVLYVWLPPRLRPAAFTPRCRALVVIDETAYGEPALRNRVLAEMKQFSLLLRSVVAPLTPHFSEHELRARLCFISGAVLGSPPRIPGAQLANGSPPVDDLSALLPFARAALSC